MKYFFNYHWSGCAEQLSGMLIVLRGDKQGGKLSADNYVKVFYLGSIIQGQFSGWQLFGGKYQHSIIQWGNSLSTTCPRANYLGAITKEAILLVGAIIREGGGGNNAGDYYPGGNCPGGNYQGRKYPGGQLSGGQLSCSQKKTFCQNSDKFG